MVIRGACFVGAGLKPAQYGFVWLQQSFNMLATDQFLTGRLFIDQPAWLLFFWHLSVLPPN